MMSLSCCDPISIFYCPILVKFSRLMQGSLSNGPWNLHKFFDSLGFDKFITLLQYHNSEQMTKAKRYHIFFRILVFAWFISQYLMRLWLNSVLLRMPVNSNNLFKPLMYLWQNWKNNFVILTPLPHLPSWAGRSYATWGQWSDAKMTQWILIFMW